MKTLNSVEEIVKDFNKNVFAKVIENKKPKT